MKIGVLKIGANITQSSSVKSAGNYDIFSLMDMIKDDHEVTFITKKTRNTIIRSPYKVVDTMDYKSDFMSLNECKTKFDCLVVFNGAINFFGGKESPELIHIWKIIQAFEGRIYYVMTDLRYPLYQMMDFFKNKPWADKYFEREQTYFITNPNIKLIYQGTNIRKLAELFNKHTTKRKVEMSINNVHSFPIDWAINMTKQKIHAVPFEDRPVDLIYGGANRDSHRLKRLTEYFGIPSEKLTTKMFGPISSKKLASVNTGSVSHNDFMKTMSQGKATIIVGDKNYQDNMFTLRMYESIYAGCITFIDEQFDPDHKFYNGNNYLQYLYVDDGRELAHKIKNMTVDQYKLLANEQLNHIRTQHDRTKYKDAFVRILND